MTYEERLREALGLTSEACTCTRAGDCHRAGCPQEGRSMRRAARRTGIPRQTLQAALKAKRGGYVDTITQIAERCGVRVGWLLTGELPKEVPCADQGT